MYSILLVPFVSALYYITTEDTFAIQSVTSDLLDSTTECVDITLQNQIPITILQEQVSTFTNYEKDYSVLYSTSTVTQETFSIETVVTSAEILAAEATISCSSEHISVYTTDLLVLNSVPLEDITTTCMISDFQIQSSTEVEIFGDLEGLPVTTTEISTSVSVSTETAIIGDLEGLPEEISAELEPNVTIAEISETVVPDIRDNGLEFCAAIGLGDFIANGTQQQFQVCSLTVQGAIPAIDKMVSTIIISPENNAVISLGTNFTITIKSLNIEYGFFDDPASLYYLSPQRLNANGIIQGHNHVAIQKLLGPGEVPSAQNPLFFKGLNDASLDGTLSTEVNGAVFTETGEYRLCTSSASQGHQPVLSPVARRFFQDDCIRFTIVN